MNYKIIISIKSILLLLPILAIADQHIPNTGLQAEMEKRWQDAIVIYQTSLQQQPGQSHLWLRIADIHAHLKDTEKAIGALENASKLAPNNEEIPLRLSQHYSAANQHQKAYKAIQRAVALSPDNIAYLSTLASHANWNKDYAKSRDAYKQILQIKKDSKEALLGLARALNWNKEYSNASEIYNTYILTYPDDKAALLEYMDVNAKQEQYTEAIAIAEQYLKRFDEDINYWLRRADIHALDKDPSAVVDAVENASRLAPQDATLLYRLTSSYSALEDVQRALTTIQQAIKLDPDNLTYIKAQANLATWAGEYNTALTSYQKILENTPQDAETKLAIAKIYAWQSKTNQSISSFKSLINQHPKLKNGWTEYTHVLISIGNYAAAQDILQQYQQHFGRDDNYLKYSARIYAWSQHPHQALLFNEPLFSALPGDFFVHATQTIALQNDNQPRGAIEALKELKTLHPNNIQTENIRLFVETPLRSHINLSANYQTDSDDIEISILTLDGVYVYNPESRLIAGVGKVYLDAPLSSGFANINGDKDSDYNRTWFGAKKIFSSKLTTSGYVGQGSSKNGDSLFIYELAADLQPQDGLRLHLFRKQDIYAVSPKAVSLNIKRIQNRLNLSWSPNLRYTIDGFVSHSTFSDNNKRYDFAFAPRRSILRKRNFMFDVGISAHLFGFDNVETHGYYSPTDYSRYSVIGFSSWQLNSNDTIRTSFSVGRYKDKPMGNSGTAGDITLEGIFGLYQDWMLTTRAAISQNTGLETGAYRAKLFYFMLTKRW